MIYRIIFITIFTFIKFIPSSHSQWLDQNQYEGDRPIDLFIKSLWETNPFQYYTQSMRAQVITELHQTFKTHYAPWDLKNWRLGLDLDQIFREAIKQEYLIKDATLRDVQAFQNVEFLDRLRKLGSMTQDTHVTIAPNLPSPYLRLGIQSNLINEKLFITGQSEKIFEYLKNRFDISNIEKLKLESDLEILSIDGKSPMELIAHLSNYISASSPDAVIQYAISDMFYRNYAYPKNPFCHLTLKSGTGEIFNVKLPWLIYRPKTTLAVNNYRGDVEWFFKLIGFYSADAPLTDWERDSSTSKLNLNFGSLKNIQFDSWNAPRDLALIKDIYNNQYEDDLVAQIGHFESATEQIAYLKILSFDYPEIYNPDSSKIENTADFLKEYLEDIQADSKGLIIDMRFNGGGSPKLAYKLASYLSSQRPLASTHASYRLNNALIDYVLSYQNLELEDWSFGEEDEFARVVQAYDLGLTYTLPYERKIEGIESVNQLPFVVLIGPECISACDGFSWIVKENQLAPLVGIPTSGTGAGFVSGNGFFEEDYWRDSQYIVKAKIPNRLFGRSLKGFTPSTQETPKSWLLKFNTENIPVQADIELLQTLHDYKNQDQDFFKKVLEFFP